MPTPSQQLGSFGFRNTYTQNNLTGLNDWDGSVPPDGSTVVYDGTKGRFGPGAGINPLAVSVTAAGTNGGLSADMHVPRFSGNSGLIFEGSALAISDSRRRRAGQRPSIHHRKRCLHAHKRHDARVGVRNGRRRRGRWLCCRRENSVGSGGNGGGTYVGLFAIDDTLTGTVTIGAGGTGASGVAGGTGGTTTFLFPSSGTPNGTITGPGGFGGNLKPTGTTDDYCILPTSTRPTPSGTAVNAVLLGGFPVWGQYGSPGIMIAADVGVSGNGGTSTWGNGAVGTVKNQVNSRTNGATASANSGGGGSGAIQTDNGINGSGGGGGSGVVVIIEY